VIELIDFKSIASILFPASVEDVGGLCCCYGEVSLLIVGKRPEWSAAASDLKHPRLAVPTTLPKAICSGMPVYGVL